MELEHLVLDEDAIDPFGFSESESDESTVPSVDSIESPQTPETIESNKLKVAALDFFKDDPLLLMSDELEKKGSKVVTEPVEWLEEEGRDRKGKKPRVWIEQSFNPLVSTRMLQTYLNLQELVENKTRFTGSERVESSGSTSYPLLDSPRLEGVGNFMDVLMEKVEDLAEFINIATESKVDPTIASPASFESPQPRNFSE